MHDRAMQWTQGVRALCMQLSREAIGETSPLAVPYRPWQAFDAPPVFCRLGKVALDVAVHVVDMRAQLHVAFTRAVTSPTLQPPCGLGASLVYLHGPLFLVV